jgi:hypothetical protein
MARTRTADILTSLALLEGLHEDLSGAGGLPGAIEHSPEEQAARFSMELSEAPDAGREMAGAYVRSYYGETAPEGITMPNYLAHASVPHVEKFLRWHAENRTAIQEHLGVQHAFLTKHRMFLHMLQRGASEGWITAFTNSQGDNVHMEAIAKTILHVGNLGDTYIDGVEGYYDSAGKALVVAPGAGFTLQERVVDTQDRIDRVLPRALGGIYGRGAASWMRSAFGEHLHQVFEEGEPLLFSPSARTENGRDHPFAVYQRELIGTLLTYEGGDLTREFMLAMTSKDSNSNEWFALRDAMDKLWGVENGFDKITEYVQRQIDTAAKQYPDAVPAMHQEQAAKETLDVLRNNPAWIFSRPERAKPAVGALALNAGGKHRPGKHRPNRNHK